MSNAYIRPQWPSGNSKRTDHILPMCFDIQVVWVFSGISTHIDLFHYSTLLCKFSNGGYLVHQRSLSWADVIPAKQCGVHMRSRGRFQSARNNGKKTETAKVVCCPLAKDDEGSMMDGKRLNIYILYADRLIIIYLDALLRFRLVGKDDEDLVLYGSVIVSKKKNKHM